MKARSKVTIMTILLASACGEWIHVETPQEALIRAKSGTIQVTKTDRTVFRINHASIVGDSVVGMDDRDDFLRAALLRDVNSIDVRQFSLRRTGMLLFGGVVATFVTAGILTATSGGPTLIGH
jgi:hypothetical protein